MSPRPHNTDRPTTTPLYRGLGALALVVLAWAHSPTAHGVGPAASANSATKPAPKAGAEEGVRWSDMKPAQQVVLKPLERAWSGIDAPRKLKWLEISARFPRMAPDEQSRVQARMAEWTALTPQERGQARMNFQEAKQFPVRDRQARWESYQALPQEQKQRLAERAAPPPASRVGPSAEASQSKSNIVPNPAFAVPPRQVSPTVTQAGPGATTTLMSKRPTPPSHQQAGLPKITATPEFVNKATLQPKRGPQAAATRSAKASEAEPAQRQ